MPFISKKGGKGKTQGIQDTDDGISEKGQEGGGAPPASRAVKLAERVQASEKNILLRQTMVKEIRYELRSHVMFDTLRTSLIFFPKLIRAFFLEACMIFPYRYEWPSTCRNFSVWLNLHHEAVRGAPNLVTLPAASSSVALEAAALVKTRARKREKAMKYYQAVSAHQHKHDHSQCARVKINVGGRIYETQIRTLQRFPHTLLGDPNRRLPFYDPLRGMYFFDRSRKYFEQILYFYQSGGRIVALANMVTDELLSEVEFFDLGHEAVQILKTAEGIDDDEDEDESELLPRNLLQRKIWLLLEYPQSSVQATIVSLISVCVVIVSITAFCIETEPALRFQDAVFYKTNNNTNDDEYDVAGPTDPLGLLEIVCVSWFTAEILLRFITSPDKYDFCVDFMNIIDLLAIVPFVINVISDNFFKVEGQTSLTDSIGITRILRIVRIFRIFKLSRHVKGLKILGWTLKASVNELGLLVFFLLVCVILFSSAVYFAEEDEPGSLFESIPHSAYWAISTMTTVGYGDVVPKTSAGKLFGSLCAITGVLTLALPMPVMVSNFNYFYNQELNKARSATERHEDAHVKMCPYLPTNGVHPDTLLSKSNRGKRKWNKSNDGRSKGSTASTNSSKNHGRIKSRAYNWRKKDMSIAPKTSDVESQSSYSSSGASSTGKKPGKKHHGAAGPGTKWGRAMNKAKTIGAFKPPSSKPRPMH